MPIRSFTNLNLTDVTKSLYRSILAAGLLAGLSSCVSSQEHEIELATTAYKDLNYYDSYTKYTNNYEVIKNFETRYRIHATLLSGEFRQAIAARHQKIFSESQAILSEASDKTGFFVTL